MRGDEGQSHLAREKRLRTKIVETPLGGGGLIESNAYKLALQALGTIYWCDAWKLIRVFEAAATLTTTAAAIASTPPTPTLTHKERVTYE